MVRHVFLRVAFTKYVQLWSGSEMSSGGSCLLDAFACISSSVEARGQLAGLGFCHVGLWDKTLASRLSASTVTH